MPALSFISETLLKRTKSRCPVCHADCPAEVWKVGDAQQQRVLLRRRMEAVSTPLKRTALLNEGKWATVDLLGLGLTWALVLIYVWRERTPGEAV